eukprot:350454-Chlamydomonas_euryale.AAC.6
MQPMRSSAAHAVIGNPYGRWQPMQLFAAHAVLGSPQGWQPMLSSARRQGRGTRPTADFAYPYSKEHSVYGCIVAASKPTTL